MKLNAILVIGIFIFSFQLSQLQDFPKLKETFLIKQLEPPYGETGGFWMPMPIMK